MHVCVCSSSTVVGIGGGVGGVSSLEHLSASSAARLPSQTQSPSILYRASASMNANVSLGDKVPNLGPIACLSKHDKDMLLPTEYMGLYSILGFPILGQIFSSLWQTQHQPPHSRCPSPMQFGLGETLPMMQLAASPFQEPLW